MKLHKIINTILAIGLGLLIVACAPIEDSRDIVNTFNPNDIQVSITQTPAGSNVLTMRMTTPGVTGFWEQPLGLGVAGFGNDVEFFFPLTGEHTFTYRVSTPFIPPSGNLMDRQFIYKTATVDIQFLDERTPPYLTRLIGDGSRAWKFDVYDVYGPFALDGSDSWWYMTDEYPEIFWWQPTPPANRVPSVDSRIIFSITKNGPSFTSYSPSEGGLIGDTRWEANADWSEIVFVGDASLPGRFDGGAPVGSMPASQRNRFQILELTDNRLALFQGTSFNGYGMGWSPGWVWVFRPVD